MAIIVQGADGTQIKVDPTFNAQRVSVRPMDHGANGVYRVSAQTSIMTAGMAANSEIFQFRWTDSVKLAVIERVTFDGMGSATAFAAGICNFRLTVCRGWTVDGSGGTSITTIPKLRNTHGSSAVGSIRIASTAALTAGTKTIEATDIGTVISSATATAGMSIPPQPLMDIMNLGHPLILTQNEGFIIKSTIAGTGTWATGFTVHWTEVSAY
jgi:hypothetical protein